MVTVTLRQLEHFVAAVEEGTIAGAAARLYVSPGGVSLAITELETVLRVQLITRRRGQGVAPTPGGREVYAQARRVLTAAADLEDVAAEVRGEVAGRLVVGCFAPLSPWLLPALAERVAAQHPGIDLALVEGPVSDLDRMVRAGLVDAALLFSLHAADDLVTDEVVSVAPRAMLRPGHRVERRKVVHLADLADEPAVLLSPEHGGDIVEEALAAVGFEPRIAWRSGNIETIRSMVARGMGWSLSLGRPTGGTSFDHLPVSYREVADDLPPNRVVLARAPGARLTARVRALLAAARAVSGS